MPMNDPAHQDQRLVVGCMTGTSLDGLDVALVEASGRGLDVRCRVKRHAQWPLGELAGSLRRIASQEAVTAGFIARVSLEFAALHARCIAELLAGERADLVAIHGQTVFHEPPASWQLMNPAPVVAAIGAPVVFDLRQADLASGGRGAPITPLADWVLFRGESGTRAVANLGGFCNVTLIPGPAGAGGGGGAPRGAGAVQGFDVCACNHVLDGVARAVLNAPFDAGGAAALRGTAHEHATNELSALLEGQRAQGRSLGTGDEAEAWISRWRSGVSPDDLAASATGAIARVIARAAAPAAEVYVAGGGALNAALVRGIERGSAGPVRPLSGLGVGIFEREAAEIAILGLLCADGVSITLEGVTGRGPARVLDGCWMHPARA